MRLNFANGLSALLLGMVMISASAAEGGWGYGLSYGYYNRFHHHPRWGVYGCGWAPYGRGSYCPIYGYVAPSPIVCNRSGCSVGAYGAIMPGMSSQPMRSEPGMPAGSPPPAAIPPAPPATTRLDDTSAELLVNVPAEAKVFINGRQTNLEGATRRFFSRGLQAGGRYAYEIRAEVVRDGRTISETQQVEVASGASSQVSLALTGDQPALAANNPVTTVLVRVPHDAVVYLEGRETAATGDVRRFSTTQLSVDGEWKDYTIRAEVRREGRVIELEKTVSVHAGQVSEVSFDFDAQQVAELAASTR